MRFFRKMRVGCVVAICICLLLTLSCGKSSRSSKNYGRFINAHDLKHLPRFDIPVEINDRVVAWMEYFQGPGRRHFARYLRRSKRYIPMMHKILKEEKAPLDLVYIAMIESGFNPHAYSHAHAVGLWQFIKSTGRRYGLQVNEWQDDRRDPYKATRAAGRHFVDLYNEYGKDWYIAMVGYNAGPGRIKKAKRISGSSNFWDMANHRRALRAETRDYVPKFIAAAIMTKMPEKFGFNNVEYEEPLDYDVTIVDSQTDLDVIADLAKTDYETISLLNPHLYKGATPPGKHKIRVPKGKVRQFNRLYAKLPKDKRMRIVRYRVQKGDTIARIARKYHVSSRMLARANGLGRKSRVRRGQTLTIPVGAAAKMRYAKGYGGSSTRKLTYHRVRRGETAGGIARKYGVKVSQLRTWNKLNRRSTIRAGKKLKIYKRVRYASGGKKVKRGASDLTHKVRRGETLGHIAGKYGVSSKQIMAWNGIKNPKRVRAGKKLVIKGKGSPKKPIKTTGVKLAELDRASTPTTTKSTGGSNTYTLKRGETLGHVAEKFGVSSRQIMRWNNIKNAKRVRAGKRLKIYASRKTPVTPAPVARAATTDTYSAPVAVSTSTAPKKRAASYYEYKVKSGETIGGIANRHGVTKKELMAWNNMRNPKSLRAGKSLLIKRGRKGSSESGVQPSPGVPVKLDDVKTGTTTTSTDIVSKPKETKIAMATSSSKSRKTYKVRSGDTLWDIARRHKISISQIQKWNSLKDPSKVKPGTTLKVGMK